MAARLPHLRYKLWRYLKKASGVGEGQPISGWRLWTLRGLLFPIRTTHYLIVGRHRG